MDLVCLRTRSPSLPQKNTMATSDLLTSSYTALTSSGKDILAGTVGGMATVLVGHPLDTIKVRLQAQSSANPMYSGAWDCAVKTWKFEGFRGFYKGMQSPLAGEGFFNAWQFLAWGQSKKWVKSLSSSSTISDDDDDELSIRQFLAGAVTGFASAFVECPVDLMKSQLQTQVFLSQPAFTTLPGCAKAIFAENGMMGLFQGLTSNILRTVPASAAYFGSYEGMRQYFLKTGQNRDELGSGYVLLSGGVGGLMYWLTTYPLDSVKSAMQADHIPRHHRKYTSTWHCAQTLYREGGAGRFFHGLSPCLLRSFPANAACFYAYETARSMMDKAF